MILNHMFSLGWLKVIEEIHGKKLSTLISEASEVSFPTARKIAYGSASEITNDAAYQKAFEGFKAKLVSEGVDQEEVKVCLEEMRGHQGAFQSVMWSFTGLGAYQKTYQFAGLIDHLWNEFLVVFLESSGNYPSGAMYRSDGISADYWRRHHDASQMAEGHATGQSEKKDNGVLWHNLVISFFALWDVEFYLRWFAAYKPRPIMLGLMPALGFRLSAGESASRRDTFLLPVRNPIDLLACIAHKINTGVWPANVPSVQDQAQMSGEHIQNLTKWRNGEKRFTLRQCEGVWRELIGPSNRARANETFPAPLYVTALYAKHNLCGLSDGFQAIDVYDDEYRYWWKRHMDEHAQGGESGVGAKEWPACLDQLLIRKQA